MRAESWSDSLTGHHHTVTQWDKLRLANPHGVLQAHGHLTCWRIKRSGSHRENSGATGCQGTLEAWSSQFINKYESISTFREPGQLSCVLTPDQSCFLGAKQNRMLSSGNTLPSKFGSIAKERVVSSIYFFAGLSCFFFKNVIAHSALRDRVPPEQKM